MNEDKCESFTINFGLLSWGDVVALIVGLTLGAACCVLSVWNNARAKSKGFEDE